MAQESAIASSATPAPPATAPHEPAHDTPPRPSSAWAGRLLKGLIRTVLALLVLLALAWVGLWWWSGTDGSLATALRWVSQSSALAPPRALKVADVTGSVRHGGRVGRLDWQDQGLHVTALDLTWRWQMLALLSGQLQIDRLHAASLRIDKTDTPAAPAPAPQSLHLPVPFNVELKDIALGQLAGLGPAGWTATQLRGRYAWTGSQHELTVTRLQLAGGRYQGQARLAGANAMTLEAAFTGVLEASAPGSDRPLPLALKASARGPVTELSLQAELALEGAAPPAGAAAGKPQASASARLMPWAAQPLPAAQANFRDLDLALLWPQAPRTQLTGRAQVQPEGTGWAWQTSWRNGRPGPWNLNQLPLDQLEAAGEWRDSTALLRSLEARLGTGRLQASGNWSGPSPAPGARPSADWQLTAQWRQLNPAAIDSRLSPQRVAGQAGLASVDGRLDFDATLEASTAAGPATGSADAITAGQWLTSLQLRDASARGSWHAQQAGGTLALKALRLRTLDATLQASGQFQPKAQGGRGQLTLSAPGLTAQVDGELRPQAGQGQLLLAVSNARQALQWLRGLSSMANLPPALSHPALLGRGQFTAAWQGGWRDPTLQAALDVPLLNLPTTSPARTTSAAEASNNHADTLRLRDLTARWNGRLSQAQLALDGRAELGQRRFALKLAAEGGAQPAPANQSGRLAPAALPALTSWQAVVQQLSLAVEDPGLGRGAWQLALQRPFDLRVAPGLVEAGPGQAVLVAPSATSATPTATPSATPRAHSRSAVPSQALLTWQPVRWRADEFITAGSLKGLPLAWVELLAGPQLAQAGLASNLMLDAEWDAVIGPTLQFKAQIARSSGDFTLQAETADGLPTRVTAALREARLSVSSQGGGVTAQLRWDSERAGMAEGQLRTQLQRLTPGAPAATETGTVPPNLAGWYWPANAPLSGQLKAQLPRLGAWSMLAPPGWRLRGALATTLAVSGTRSAPALSGELQANDLALRSVVDGIEFGQGRLRAQFEGTRLRIAEFSLRGAGPNDSGGLLSAEGEAGWVHGQPQVSLNARLEGLRASIRSDRQVTVSGNLQASLQGTEAAINGLLKVDRARILLPDESRPQLGDDVVVRNAPGKASTGGAPSKLGRAAGPTLKTAIQIDLGDDFRIEGKGVDTRMRGILALLGDSASAPRLYGTLLTHAGQYRAYGQRLDIEEGLLRFSGPIDNPTLEILAIRPNMTQRVGVQISGTALLPQIRLYAEPDLPDAEKLSWLVLGRSSATGGAEAALLQQAAIALLGSKTGGMSGGLAATLGLDELSIRGPSSDSTSAGAITLGKRFSRNFYAAYERSLSGTLGTLYLFYELSQRFTVRAEAGQNTAVDLIFTIPYE